MEGDSSLITFSDEYRLLEVYHQKRSFRQGPCLYMCRTGSKPGGEKYSDVAEKLTQIVDSGLLVRDGVEADGEESNDDVIQRLVDLLKESGDELNQKIQKSYELLGYLQSSFSYSLFDRLTSAFIGSVVPEHERSRMNREQIALTFEVTSRLNALDLHPMNRIMGFGAQYLQQHFTPWIHQHGGWEKAFVVDDEDEIH
ncbi:apoptosis facilitator Bcl-2-like protein 14 [Myxocyprinus asiaticus]|uniref:apoptosis facilitator Bcl-2-like protein 14 n=1 Tax=Myxocyprinus asiaticus TaxID=70543 RepID=UPI002223EB28|nr:apoptosis facilitator Bcl-2-like protein 14 [Myxocyprinus asiaticus]XP_051512446.1 apoptosis facilitator Bcl-2-like protein 14 [Myxocyprinus asiaticus]